MEFFYYLSDREHIILIFDSTKSIITNGKIIDSKEEQPEKAPYKTFPPVIVTDFNDEGM